MKLDEQFPIEKISQFVEIDSLPNSHPLSIDSPNKSSIFQLYDSISYYKGATVIRMMSMILGASTFQQGLQMYLTAFSYNSTTRYDLWKYLTIATNYTINIEQIMEGWTRQAGYPLIEVNRIGNQMILKQRPFNLLSSNMSNKNLWWIPLKYFDKTSNQVK
jgi:aminopeptidase 2